MTNETDDEVRPVEEVWGDFDVRRTVMGLCDGTIGLHDVEWSKMRHGYGDAGSVPLLLERIAGGDTVLAAQAMDTMWDMGFVAGVTTVPGALATPFLIRAATDPAARQRPAVRQRFEPLRFAAHAARCDKCFQEGRAELLQVVDTVPPEVRYDVSGYVATWSIEAARHAIGTQTEPLSGLLGDPDCRIRRYAAYALASALPAGDTVLRSLRARIPVETDDAVQVSLVLAAAQHSRELGLIEPALDLASALWSDHEKPSVVRVAGAIAWLCLTSEPPPPMLARTVTELATPSMFEALQRVPWIDHLQPDRLPIWLDALLHDPASGAAPPPQLWPQPAWDPWETTECQR